ncbi:MAG: diphthamide synthesis protein [Nanoarchaeota archaeon]
MVDYDLEIEEAVQIISSEKAKTVLVQLPDGLKKEATLISSILKEKTGAEIIIWAESTFGACDIPDLPVDIVIQWGHTQWTTK